MGDFNIDYSSRNSTSKSLKDFAFEYDLKQIIQDSTRITEHSRTTIDLVFVNFEHNVVQSGVLHTSLSDHCTVFCVMKSGVTKAPPKTFEFRSYKSYNKETFVEDMKQAPWSIVDSVNDIDDCVFLWERLFSGIADSHAPIKFKRVKGFKNPWVTQDLLDLRKDRDYHHKKAINGNNKYHWSMYRKLRNKANSEERKLKSDYYCQLINEAKNDSSKMWRTIKSVLPGNKASDVYAILDNGKLHKDSKSIAGIFNDFFSSIGKQLSKAFNKQFRVGMDNPINTYRFKFHDVDENFVKENLKNLKTNKACGLDKISSRLLKDAAEVISHSLTLLINKSLNEGCFPATWKSAKVTALFKGGDKTSKDNYRPISILPTISKIIEKAAHIQLYGYLEENNLLINAQYGFRHKRSTTSALINFTDNLLDKMDKGQTTGVVFLDLKKAFDTVNHDVLIGKLKSLGISGTTLQWFNSYLRGRTQRTVCSNDLSCSAKISIGVPQGSILGPLLFLVYINGIHDVTRHTTMTMFADDMAISYSSTCASDLQQKLNEDVRSITTWLHENKLTLNVEKSKFMLIGTPGQLKKIENIHLSVNCKYFERVKSFKYLGVIMNENMTWSDHIEYIHGKVTQRLGILKRIKHLLPIDTRRIYVSTMVLPIIEYACLVWGDKNNKVLMDSLQILQNKAARLVLDLPPFFSGSEALKLLNWQNLQSRRSAQRCLWMYQLVHDQDNCTVKSGSNIHSYNTRNKDKLRTEKSNLNKGLQKSYNSFLSDWNNLTVDVRNLPTKKHFKNAIWNNHNN